MTTSGRPTIIFKTGRRPGHRRRRRHRTRTRQGDVAEPAAVHSSQATLSWACRQTTQAAASGAVERHEDAFTTPRPRSRILGLALGSAGNLFAKSCSAPNASRSTHEASRSHKRLRRGRPRVIRCQAGSPTMALSCSTPIARSPNRSTKAAPSRRPPNGWSTITISSSARSAKSAPHCRPATTGNCPSWPTVRSSGYPRVFGLAWAFVAHTDSRFDAEMLCRFVRAYQEVQPLTIGELWAVAITLRIVLVENLRRLAERIVYSSDARGRRRTLSPTACWAPAGTPPSRRRSCSPSAKARRLSDAFARPAGPPAARSGSQDHALR